VLDPGVAAAARMPIAGTRSPVDASCSGSKKTGQAVPAPPPDASPGDSADTGTEPVFVLSLPLELPQGFTKAGKAKPPLKLAPTLNEYNGMKPWMKTASRLAVDHVIATTFSEGVVWSGAWLLMIAGKGELRCQKRRRVVVTRYSSRQPDEIACDIIGGKIPIDRLVKLGILAGDSAKWLEREARWVRVKPGEGKLVVEVFDV
jgi:hypothetical protein